MSSLITKRRDVEGGWGCIAVQNWTSFPHNFIYTEPMGKKRQLNKFQLLLRQPEMGINSLMGAVSEASTKDWCLSLKGSQPMVLIVAGQLAGRRWALNDRESFKAVSIKSAFTVVHLKVLIANNFLFTRHLGSDWEFPGLASLPHESLLDHKTISYWSWWFVLEIISFKM